MDVLVVVDMQKCFLEQKETDLPNRIRRHIQEKNYDMIFFSQLVNQKSSNFYERLDWKDCMNSEEIQIVSELKDLASENTVVQKETYSVFKSEEFNSEINLEEVNKLNLCGVDSDACVLATAFEAFDKNLDFEILRELTESTSENRQEFEEYAERIMERSLSRN